MTLRTVIAIAGSLLAHGLLALVLVAYLEYGPQPDALATLDLSRVELSFAEQVDESAEVALSLPSEPAQMAPKPSQEENPPEVVREKPLPPKTGEMSFPEPEETVCLPEKEKDAKAIQPSQTIKQSDNLTAKQPASSSVAPQQAQIDAPPQPWRAIRPVYPKRAQRRGEQGEVEVEIDVKADGTVASVSVIRSSGFPELDEAAVKAVRTATFRPARASLEAVRSTVRQKLEFRLK